MKRKTIFCLIILGIPILLAFASNAIQMWHHVYDDAFITYRYAKNLSLGYGITWNPGHAPTEGYTNFLLVIVLAPFIKGGIDPLLVTRVLSYFSAVAMSIIIFIVAKRRYGCTTSSAMMIASLILLAQQTRTLCLVGLETVIYAFLLLINFHVGIEFIYSRRIYSSVLFSVLIIFTMLLRPEAAFLYLAMLLLYCIYRGPRQILELKPLILGLLILLTLGGTYLVWKVLYFGHIFPNAFYIKVSNSLFISPLGIRTVFHFVSNNVLLIALSYASILFCFNGVKEHHQKSKISILLGMALVLLYVCFFVRTDTLMDIGGRFMYPLLPILIYMSIPILASTLEVLESWTTKSVLTFSGMVFSVLLIFGPGDVLHIYGNMKLLAPNDSRKTDNSEFRIAKALSTFPGIESIRIAFGDSGVIPYFTGSVWLDVVGLNDGVIARSRNKKELIDHFFHFQADIVIHPGSKDYSWINYGHGPLGDYSSWADDPRWDDYAYIGTVKTSGNIYDLQFFVRKSSSRYQTLKEFLCNNIIDGWYEPLPFHIGTWKPKKEIQPTWIPRLDLCG